MSFYLSCEVIVIYSLS